jgi:hypothetical protein
MQNLSPLARSADSDNPLVDIVSSLNDHVSQLEAMGYGETAALLRIGQLDLRCRLNAISEEELRRLGLMLRARQVT